MATNDSMIQVKDLKKHYKMGTIRALDYGLDPAASYRLTISYDSSRYYLYGGLKVEGIAG